MKGNTFKIWLKQYNVFQLEHFMEGIQIMEMYLPVPVKDSYKLRKLKAIVAMIAREKGSKKMGDKP